jgi:LPS export ABC transporter protein LptC
MTSRFVALLAVLALVVGMVVLTGPTRESTAHATAAGPAHDPGYSALKARLVQTGPDGQPLYTLDAAQIQQQPDNGLIDLQQVQLGFRDASGDVWTARSLRGQLAPDSGVVQLAGDVHIAGILPGTQDMAEFTTEHLSYDTNAQIATTHDPITLTMAGSGRQISATGMVASLKERHVQLESAVHGSYLP